MTTHTGKLSPDYVEYIRERMYEVQKKYGLTTTKMAELVCYERSSFHRVMTKGTPTLQILFALSKHFQIPMDFWFPLEMTNLEPPKLPETKGCVCDGAAPLSIDILNALLDVDALGKSMFLEAIQDPLMIQILESVLKFDRSQKEILLKVLPQFKKESK